VRAVPALAVVRTLGGAKGVLERLTPPGRDAVVGWDVLATIVLLLQLIEPELDAAMAAALQATAPSTDLTTEVRALVKVRAFPAAHRRRPPPCLHATSLTCGARGPRTVFLQQLLDRLCVSGARNRLLQVVFFHPGIPAKSQNFDRVISDRGCPVDLSFFHGDQAPES
jgi:hypothetical protein